jgi:hypothetical protein
MNEIEKRAREILAAEYERDSRNFTARRIRSGRQWAHECDVDRALRAIVTALSSEQGSSLYYVARIEGGDFDNIPISMFGQPAIFSSREAAENFRKFANGAGARHKVFVWPPKSEPQS